MKCSIICVGSELLNGLTLETNSDYIISQLNNVGLQCDLVFRVGDDIKAIKKSLAFAKKQSALVIISGGLGPTIDDLTKDAISEHLDLPLIYDEKDFETLSQKLINRGLVPSEQGVREILKPQGAISIENNAGIAPCFFIDGIAAFPGVPRELKDIFPRFLDFFINAKGLQEVLKPSYKRELKFWGIPESKLNNRIKDILTHNDLTFEILVKDNSLILYIEGRSELKEEVDRIVEEVYNRLGDKIFGEGDDTLEGVIKKLMIAKGLKMSVAESCTGGLLSARIVALAGVSSFFEKGLITYSNDAKIELLGVKGATLEKYGAVSQECCQEMLEGLSSEIRIATTGLAGPGGGTAKKSVGLVYIGIYYKGRSLVKEYTLRGDRNRIQNLTVNYALFHLWELLKVD